jgi:site-specific DNA-methyltransferase (adenine-specific)
MTKKLEDYIYYKTDLGVLYCGDNNEILPLITEPIDLVLTDPPYLIGAKGGGLARNMKYLKDITNANIEKGVDYSFLNGFKNWFCFCSKAQLKELIGIAEVGNWNILTWNKTNPTPLTNNNYLPDTEYIIHAYEKGRLFGTYADKSKFIVSPTEKNEFDHPTVKPLIIINKLIVLGSRVNELVLDPFSGSGSTCVACEVAQRRYIGIEISEKYCEIAKKRIEVEARQTKMFE